jgi:hypothetical protein
MLSITKYQYNNLCDTYGCNNRAKHSLGREGYPKRAAHNICEQCLEDIAMQVPLEMVLKREDLQEHLNELAETERKEAPSVPFDGDEVEVPTPDDIPFSEDFEAELIDSYSYKELQEIAKELGLPYVGIKTQALKDSILTALKDG